MKLEVGQFVRTKDGYISQYKYYDTTNAYMEKLLCIPLSNGTFANIEDIVKASYNIIDILECGDIIKLFMEDDIDGEDTNIFELIAINYNDNEIGVFNSDFQIEFFPIENLRGILTHEQM